MTNLVVADVMQREVRSVHPAMQLAELEEVLLRARISGAPVVENGRVVGVVSRSDVVRQLALEQSRAEESAFYLQPFEHEPDPERFSLEVSQTVGARLARARVADVMIASVICIAPSAPISEAAALMLERRVHRLLVVEDDRLSGILSSLDLVRLLANPPVAA